MPDRPFRSGETLNPLRNGRKTPDIKSAQLEGKKLFYSKFTTNVAKIVY
jgi:hypothetical protein